MQAPPILLTPHRRARLTALLRLAFMWAAAVLFGALAPKPRYIKQRRGWLRLDGLIRMVCGLALIRATELAYARSARRPKARGFAPSGFRRAAPRNHRRIMTGAHLRRWFKHKDKRVVFDRALDALADLDAFVRKHLLKRAQRGLTRLRPLIAVRPPAQSFISAASPAPQVADSS